MEYAILALVVCLASGKAIFCKRIGSAAKNMRDLAAQNCGVFAVAFVVSALLSLGSLDVLVSMPAPMILFALLFAAVMLATQFTEMRAMALGPASLTILIYSAGFLIPIIFELLYYHKAPDFLKVPGIVLLFAALALILISPESKKRGGMLWLLFAVAALCGSGATAILQMLLTRTPGTPPVHVFLVFVFLFCAVFSALLYFVLPKTEPLEQNEPVGQTRGKVRLTILNMAGNGLCVGLLNFLNMQLTGKLPAVIQFPIYNGGHMVLTGLFSMVILREAHTTRQKIGFFIGIAAIILIGVL